MITPHMGNRPSPGQTWAADNGRFAAPERYTDAGYLAWLRAMPSASCLFATAPDVVADAVGTLLLSGPMYRPIREAGYPVALVAQDGLERLQEFIPWHDFDALFIGGTTEWKLGEAVHALVAEAKRRGKWVHMGRVNSLRRLRLAQAMGCDSADGTRVKYAPDINTAAALRWLETLHREPPLPWV